MVEQAEHVDVVAADETGLDVRIEHSGQSLLEAVLRGSYWTICNHFIAMARLLFEHLGQLQSKD